MEAGSHKVPGEMNFGSDYNKINTNIMCIYKQTKQSHGTLKDNKLYLRSKCV